MVFVAMIASVVCLRWLWHFPLVERCSFENKMLVMLVDPGGFPLRTWGHVELDILYYQKAGMEFLRDLQHWSFAEDPEGGK